MSTFFTVDSEVIVREQFRIISFSKIPEANILSTTHIYNLNLYSRVLRTNLINLKFFTK